LDEKNGIYLPKAVQNKTSCTNNIIYFRTSSMTMDNKAKAMRQRLKVKWAKKEMDEKEKKARLEKQGMKRVDGILTAEENHLIVSEETMSLNQMTILRRKTDPGYEPKEIGVPNKYGRYNMVPYAEALRRERNGTLNQNQSLNKYGSKSLAKQIKTGRVKMQFSCENCHKTAQDVEPPISQCSRCWGVAYCSRECQVSHWKKHKYDCTRMKVEGCKY
jgi:hypothetical protein